MSHLQYLSLSHSTNCRLINVPRSGAPFVYPWLMSFLNGIFTASFSLFSSFQYGWLETNVQYKFLPMTGFEPQTSVVGSYCSTNWGTTNAISVINLFSWGNLETSPYKVTDWSDPWLLEAENTNLRWSITVQPVWPGWAIYWTLGNFLKPLATNNLPKSPHILRQFL